MFYKHSILEANGENLLYLYLEPTYEFAQEFYSDRKQQSIYEKVSNYIKNKGIVFQGNKVFLVINDIVVSSLTISPFLLDGKQSVDQMFPFYKHVEFLRDFLPENTNIEFLDTDEEPLVQAGKFIDIKRSSGILKRLFLEDYAYGVVANDMALFYLKEARKARAVLARSYALRMEIETKVITDYNPVQNFQDDTDLKSLWKDKYDEVTTEIKEAVKETMGEYLTYHNHVIIPYTHIVNSGKTEDAEDYLFVSIPYLKCVESPWDKELFPYSSSISFSYEELSKLLNQTITEKSIIEVTQWTKGGRVKQLRIGSYRYRADYLARILSLRSTDFLCKKDDLDITFTFFSLGTGLGMSLNGANGMAKNGKNYKEILKYYFPHTEIKKISESTQLPQW